MVPTETSYGSQFQPQMQGYDQEEAGAQEFLRRVLTNFAVTLLIAAVGAFAGWSLPPAMYLGLIVIQLGLTLAVVFTRSNRGVSPLLVYAFAACSGATTVPLIKWAIGATGGTAVVYNALAITGTMFLGLALYGQTTKRDLSGWGPFLSIGLFGVLITLVVGMFLQYSTPTQLMIQCVIVVLFAGFTAYDINQIKLRWREMDVNSATLSLYLDFLNLFVSILRILTILSGNSRDD